MIPSSIAKMLTRLQRALPVLLLFFLVAIGLRLPFFFQVDIDWDESTFILMGQAILDGHLPYLQLWDLKPPIAFFCYAIFIALLGKSIIAIRLAGAICVVIIAFITYLIGNIIWPQRRVGLVAGLLTIALISSLPSGMATMTETVALVPLMMAMGILVQSQTITPRLLFWVGVCLAIAALVRLNLLYVSLTIGGIILALGWHQRHPLSQLMTDQLGYGGGHLGVVLATMLPYLYQGAAPVWWSATLVAPLTYAGSSASAMEALAQQWSHIGRFLTHYGWLGSLTWIASLLGMGAMVLSWRQWSWQQRRAAGLTLGVSGAIAVSIMRGGATHAHYLIQLAPFVCLLSAVGLGRVMGHTLRRWAVIGLVIATLGITATTLVIPEYQGLVRLLSQGQPIGHQGPAHRIADYIEQHRLSDGPIYLMIDHIAYWFLNEAPLSKCTTHPSNIGKPYLWPYCADHHGGAPDSEMAQLLALAPEFIVKAAGKPWYLQDTPEAWTLLEQALQTDYKLVAVVEQREIYHRLEWLKP